MRQPPANREACGATIRQRLHAALLAGPLTARDLSRQVGIREHDVAEHLEHLERSLKQQGATLIVELPNCLACGFSFAGRHRFTRPGSCPRCRGRRISLPRFHVAPVSHSRS